MFKWMGRSHRIGEALNVALLVPESERVLPGVLLKTRSTHYASPGKPRFLMSGTLIFSHNSQNMTNIDTKFGMRKLCVVP